MKTSHAAVMKDIMTWYRESTSDILRGTAMPDASSESFKSKSVDKPVEIKSEDIESELKSIKLNWHFHIAQEKVTATKHGVNLFRPQHHRLL